MVSTPQSLPLDAFEPDECNTRSLMDIGSQACLGGQPHWYWLVVQRIN